MDRLAAGRALRERVEAFARLLVVRDRIVEMLAFASSVLSSGSSASMVELDIADEAEIELAAPAEIFRADVDLRDLAVGREELLVGKIGAEHQQHVAGVHGRVARREADEAGHADIVGVVVFDMLLAAERMHDRALQGLGTAASAAHARPRIRGRRTA